MIAQRIGIWIVEVIKMTAPTQASSSTPINEKEQQKIIGGYQKLRDQQQNVMNELAKLRVEHREHAYYFIIELFFINSIKNRTVLKTIQTWNQTGNVFDKLATP
ncbi:hypothetical protein ACQ4LE_011188 [Meloidogyne hapla]